MTTHDVAKWFDGLRNWLGDDLNRTAVKSLAEVSEAIQELPNKPFREFVKDIKALQNGGVDVLVEEMKGVRNGHGGAAHKLIARLKKLKKPELQAITRALGLPSDKSVDESKRLLREYLGGTNGSPPETNGASSAASDTNSEVEAGYRDFCHLRDALSDLSIPDVRAQFEGFRRFSRPILEAIAKRLGYHFQGSKDELYNQLLQTLEGMRISKMRGKIIDSL